MATLEKIRSQQKLLFTIVIIALFLFIISIASADSIRRLFGPGTTIAQVGNKEIDYNDYRQLVDKINQQNQQQMNRDELSQRAINSLVQEALLNDQIEKLGIRVTDAEISRAMTGEFPHPAASRFIQTVAQYLQLPSASGAAVLDAITNPGRYNLTNDQLNYLAQNLFGTYTMGEAWAQQEDAVEKTIQQQVFGNLINGLFTANRLDAQSIYNDNSNTSFISYASVPYASVPDEEIEVTDADLQAKYNELKALYKLNEETREVDYIIVPIEPSKADYDAAEVEVDRLVEALRAQSGIDGATASSKFVQDHNTVALNEIKKNRDLALIPDSLLGKDKVYKYRRNGNTFRIAKVMDVTPQIDSINVSIYAARNAAEADSVMALIQGGKTFAQLAAESQGQAADSMWNSLVGAPEELAARFANATIGETFVYTDSLQGVNSVYRVNNRKAPKQYADITLFTYVVDPSSTTITDIKTQLSSFLASNSKADLFSANADSLYTLRHASVSPSTPKLGYNPATRSAGYEDTRHAIKWAMNAKKGEVSPILEDNRDYYVVVALKDIYGDQYIPYNATQVKDVLTSMVKADKKGDKLVEKYQGKANDLAGYAQLMGTEVRTDSTVVFAAPRFATLMGNEYALQAEASAAQKGAVVGPVKGANEVVVFVVDDTNASGRPFDFDQDKATFMSAFGIKDYFTLLLGDRKIKNNTLKFENYDK